MPKLREDQAAIHVQVYDPTTGNPILDSVVWASMDGGDIEATDTKTRPGGMGDEENLGGPRTRSDCTVERQYTNDVLHPLIPALERATGGGAGKISWTPLDGDGNPNGQTESITGILKGVKKPKWDANASNTAFLVLTFGCNATPTVIS
jgi:hypothetical protein